MTGFVIINEKGTQRVLRKHPWVFRSDIREASSGLKPGNIVRVKSKNGKFLGQAFYNEHSLITLRFISYKDEPIDQTFWYNRFSDSISRRQTLDWPPEQGRRLIYGESDFLPGCIVDQYRDVYVFQTLCAGMDQVRPLLIEYLKERGASSVVERNDVSVRELEGLSKQKGVVFGEMKTVEVTEGHNRFIVNPLEGQKTGFFLDQSQNHIIASRYAFGKALDVFSYQGGFSLSLSPEVEAITAVDASGTALQALKENAIRNGRDNIQCVEANAFDYLRELSEGKEKYDTIVLDPPPFMKSKKNKEAGLAGYKEINLRAMKILKPGGVLITASCSQNFTPDLFSAMLEEAAHDAKRDLQIIEIRGAAPDHPVLMSFPESHYLQCWMIRVLY